MLLYKSVKSKTTAGRKFWKTNINVIQCKLHQVKHANKHYSRSQNHKKTLLRHPDVHAVLTYSRGPIRTPTSTMKCWSDYSSEWIKRMQLTTNSVNKCWWTLFHIQHYQSFYFGNIFQTRLGVNHNYVLSYERDSIEMYQIWKKGLFL